MSAGKQKQISVSDAPQSHLSPKRQNGTGLEAKKDCEWHCTVCGARITVSPTNENEYGHRGDCPHRMHRGDDE